MIQEPVTLFDYCGALLNGASLNSNGTPIIGLTMASGLVYSTQEVTLTLKQGVAEHLGAFAYRHERDIVVPAGGCRGVEFPIFGKYCSLEIANASGVDAYIEVFFCVRSRE
jgi:hypothetical protein